MTSHYDPTRYIFDPQEDYLLEADDQLQRITGNFEKSAEFIEALPDYEKAQLELEAVPNPPLFSSNDSNNSKRLTDFEQDDIFDHLGESELNKCIKKVKTQNINSESFAPSEDCKQQESPVSSIFDEIDVNLLEKYNPNNWLASTVCDLGSTQSTSAEATPHKRANFVKNTSKSWEHKRNPNPKAFSFSNNFPKAHSQTKMTYSGSICVQKKQVSERPAANLPNNNKIPIPSVFQLEDSVLQDRIVIKDCLRRITKADFERLKPNVYLNDNIINFYLTLINNGFLSEERRKKCFFFNTYFMPRMKQLFAEVGNDFSQFDKVYENMKKWTRKINFFDKDFLFLPMNENEHWNLIVVCYPYRLLSKDGELPFIIFMDSLRRMDDIYAKMLYQFFSREARSRESSRHSTNSSENSSFIYYQHMIPKQDNLSDCGLYLLQYVEMFAEDETFILNHKENLNKVKWFPRKLIKEKRKDINRLIKDLICHRFATIEDYLQKRSKIIQVCQNKSSEYESFNKKSFDQAFAIIYVDKYVTDDDKVRLMLDYYYQGMLDLKYNLVSLQNNK